VRRFVETSEECRAHQQSRVSVVARRGMRLDRIFEHEVCRQRVDYRLGITLIAHLPIDVVGHIWNLQRQLQRLEPSLCPYPASALHFTVQAISFELTAPDMERVAERSNAILRDLTRFTQPIQLQPLLLMLDEDGCALHFTPADDSLLKFRLVVSETLEASGLAVNGRPSAHISIARPIRRCANLDQLIEFAASYQPPCWSLSVSEVILLKGRTRYCLPGRVEEVGRYALGSERRYENLANGA